MEKYKENIQAENPLGTAPVGGLIRKFAIPAIISMLVSAMYNIVDQIFIGQGVGMLGNAATNVAFPVTTIATAMALLLGIGGASNYNLEMGAGREKKASGIADQRCSFMCDRGAVSEAPSYIVRCNEGCYALCCGLYRNHSIGASVLYFICGRKSCCQGRQKSHLFYGLRNSRCSDQYHPGSSIYLWI